eukprot:2177751-Pyramimonas_sp.AAC.2
MGFVRKDSLCSCGCSGYCSVHSLLKILQWQLRILADGQLPALGHDGKMLDDRNKDEVSGDLTFKGMVLYIKGDWSERHHSTGLPSWQGIYHSCPFCSIPKDIRCAVRTCGHMTDGGDYPEKTHDDFDAACSRAEQF